MNLKKNYMMTTRGRKCITMLDGFILDKEDEKKFMKLCQKSFLQVAIRS
jgi:hypothetical protein